MTDWDCRTCEYDCHLHSSLMESHGDIPQYCPVNGHKLNNGGFNGWFKFMAH
jgi:hypothetical protein